MTLAFLALLASSSVATGTTNIRVSIAHRGIIKSNGRGVAIALNSPTSFRTKTEGRIVLIIPE